MTHRPTPTDRRTPAQRHLARVLAPALLVSAGLSGCASSGPALPEPTPLRPLVGIDRCTRCSGYLLPGRAEPSAAAAIRIDSDLPEMFQSTGVLYSTAAVLPPFQTKDGRDVPESQRRQQNAGFAGVDEDFEVFLYHMSQPGESPRQRRVLVWAWNRGTDAVGVDPVQIMESRGTMAKPDGPESRLAVRTLAGSWDRVVGPIDIPAGEGRVIGWSPTLSVEGAAGDNADASPSDFFTGMLRARVRPVADARARPNLEIAVVAIDGAVTREGFAEAVIENLARGARSSEGAMDLTIAPPECHVRRVVGVFRNFRWIGDPIVVDVTRATKADTGGAGPGVAFLMAAPRVQTVGCPEARQTQDMLLSPGYVHAETIGNYQIEYRLVVTLTNPSDRARSVDLRFGKQDADIGLAWQIGVAERTLSDDELMTRPIHVQWAGAWRKDDLADNTRSLLEPAPLGTPSAAASPRSITIPANGQLTVTLRFVPVGTSSLPFHLHVVPTE